MYMYMYTHMRRLCRWAKCRLASRTQSYMRMRIHMRRLCRWADVLVGLHGAGLANIIFAREGAVLIEFKGDYGRTDYG